MNTKKQITLSIVHLYITISTIILTIKGVLYGAADGQLGNNMINLGYFKAFTVDSNILSGISSLLIAIYLLKNIKNENKKLPYAMVLLQLMSAVSVGLTFLVTATFLAPKNLALGNSYWIFFAKDMFFLHLLTPFLTIGSFIISDDEYNFSIKENFLSLIPLGIYAAIYITNCVFLHTWNDFYGFTFGGINILVIPVLIIIIGLTFGIGALILLCKKGRGVNQH